MHPRATAQVGIRTDNPQGMLHIDAQGNTLINPPDTLNVADDVVFTAEGRIGLGVIRPQARLHIRDAVRPVIRIADTTQGPGMVLMSDATGAARWESLTGSWYAALEDGHSEGSSTGTGTAGWPDYQYDSFEESTPGSVNRANGTIQVPYQGTYRITITGNVDTNRTAGGFLAYVSVFANGVKVTDPHQHSSKSFGAINFGFMLYTPLNAGDVVRIIPFRETNNSSWGNRYTNVMLHVELVQ